MPIEATTQAEVELARLEDAFVCFVSYGRSDRTWFMRMSGMTELGSPQTIRPANVAPLPCGDCGEPAAWIPHAQFAGDHPFCDAHARREKDFGEDSFHAYWEGLAP